MDVGIPGDRNTIKKEAEKILKYKELINSVHVECETKSDTSNTRGDWNYSKITHIIPEHHNKKERN